MELVRGLAVLDLPRISNVFIDLVTRPEDVADAKCQKNRADRGNFTSKSSRKVPFQCFDHDPGGHHEEDTDQEVDCNCEPLERDLEAQVLFILGQFSVVAVIIIEDDGGADDERDGYCHNDNAHE